MTPWRRGSDTLVIATAVAVIASALVVSRTSTSFAQEAPPADAETYLEKMAGTDKATYHARRLAVFLGETPSNAVLEVTSSPRGSYVRAEAGAGVTRVWKGTGRRVVSGPSGAMEDRSPPAVGIRSARVLAKYNVVVEDPETLLGVDVVPLALQRRSDRRTIERLWVHADSGIVYRREFYGDHGELLGLTTILDMAWGEEASAEAFDAQAQPPSRVDASRLRGVPPMLPNGYRLLDASTFEADGRRTQHWMYSDGLHLLSVFRTRGAVRAPPGFVATDVAGHRGWIGPGPGTWAWDGGGAAWVIVAEEPGLDATEMTRAFPHGGRTAWARMGSLWSEGFGLIGDLIG
jgi:hypothetical protein